MFPIFISTLRLPFTELYFKPAIPPYFLIIVFLLLLVLAVLSTIRYPASRAGHRPLPDLKTRWLLFFLRMIAIGALMIILLNPVTLTTSARDGSTHDQGVLNILIDHSQSMATRDIPASDQSVTNTISRFEAMQEYFANPTFQKQLTTGAQARYYFVGNKLVPTTADDIAEAVPDADDSRLTELMQSFLRNNGSQDDSSPILLITDGRDTTGRSLAELAPDIRAADVPVYIVPLGSPRKQPDLALQLFADQSRIITGQATTLRANISKSGNAPSYAEIILKQNHRIIERQRVFLRNNNTRFDFKVIPEPVEDQPILPGETGIADYEMTVDPFPGELNTTNNSRHTFIEMSDEKIRILLLENEPYWDTRFLIRALRADPKVELTTVIGLNQRVQHVNRYGYGDTPSDLAAFTDQPETLDPFGIGSGSPVEIPIPTSVEQFGYYDIVVLGKGIERWISGVSATALTHFVIDDGGSVLFARGVPCNISTEVGRRTLDVLSDISPVQWGEEILQQGGQLTRTPVGRLEQSLDFEPLGNTDVILTQLPGMIAQTVIRNEKSLSTVWLRDVNNENVTDDQTVGSRAVSEVAPAAVAQARVGRGQSLAILTHGLWQWAMQSPDSQHLTKTFDLFWTRTIRFLAHQGEFLPGQTVNISLDRLSCIPGQSVRIAMQTRYISDPAVESSMLSIITPDGQSTVLPMEPSQLDHDLRSASYTPRQEGVYRVVLDTPGLVPQRLERYFAAYDFHRELIDTSADLSSLESLAQEPLVQLIDMVNPDQILNQLEKWKQSTRLIEKSLPKWDTMFCLVIVLLTLGLDWYLRRRVRLF